MVRNPGRSLAHNRPNGGSFADKISAIGIWLKNRVRDDTSAVKTRTGTGAEMFDVCLLRVVILAVAVAATDEKERDNPHRSQDGASSNNASYY